MTTNKKTLPRILDVSKYPFLGSGSYGKAYDLENGYVLKITQMENEIRFAKENLRKRFNFLAYIEDIEEVRLYGEGDEIYHAITVEKVDTTKMEDYYSNIYNAFSSLVEKENIEIKGITETEIEDLLDRRHHYISDYFYEGHTVREELTNKTVDHLVWLFKKIFLGFHHLKEKLSKEDGLYVTDLHFGNVGFRNNDGTLIAFDQF